MIDLLTVLARQLGTGDVVLAVACFLLGTWACYRTLRVAGLLRTTRRRELYAQFASQIGTLLALEQAYEFTRAQIPHRTDIALFNAYRLLGFEWRHGLFVEQRIQHFFLRFTVVMNAVDLFYVLAHAFVTIGVLGWIYACRRRHYPFLRNMMVVTTAIALIAFYVYPTAPPRLLTNYGFVDPLQLHHLVSDGGAQPNSFTYNPYAAMPSLHVAYALVASWAILLAERRWLVRGAACLYPLAMAAAVVISGNHWILDVLGAFLTVACAAVIVWLLGRLGHVLSLIEVSRTGRLYQTNEATNHP